MQLPTLVGGDCTSLFELSKPNVTGDLCILCTHSASTRAKKKIRFSPFKNTIQTTQNNETKRSNKRERGGHPTMDFFTPSWTFRVEGCTTANCLTRCFFQGLSRGTPLCIVDSSCAGAFCMVSSRALRRMLFVHCGSRCLCRNLLFGVLWDARIAADFGRRSFEVLGFGRATRLAGANFCVWGVGQQPKSNFEPEPVRLQSPVLNHAPVLNPAHVKREMDASESDCEILVCNFIQKQECSM